jgi:putative sterol carrier protein
MSSDVKTAIEALPKAFRPEKAGNAQAQFQLDLSGDSGGKWILDVADGICVVHDGTADAPDVTVSMDAEDFVAMFNNQLDPVQAFMKGKIKVTGNLGLVMRLLNWFERGT